MSATAVMSAAASIERTFIAEDGARLQYRAWECPGATKAIVLFHRGHEHSGRLDEFARFLCRDGVSVFAWDQRGHGKSPGERGFAESFGTLVKEADTFCRFISCEHGFEIEDIAVVGHSVGAVIAAAWVHDYAPRIAAMALVAPAFRVNLYVPLAIPALRVFNRIKRPAYITSYVKSKLLTSDANEAAAYDRDELISKQIAVNILLGLHDAGKRLIADAGAIRTPTMVLSAGNDWVVSNASQLAFYENLGTRDRRLVTLPGFKHAVLHERDRKRVFGEIDAFIRERLFAESRTVENIPHRVVEPTVMQRIGFAISKVFLRSLGRLSKGVQIGWKAGFDSGQSLDHVYLNKAKGITPLGKLIDRGYLDSPGWNGIRARKANMIRVLSRAMQETHAAAKPVRILDVAAGPGRYVLETMKSAEGIESQAVLRDRDPGGLEEGRAIAAAMNMTNVKYESGDAFDPASFATVNPSPTIAIVSGVYELFSDNAMILRSLRGLHAILPAGGTLIYTNQPWHPQLAFIAAVLTNRDGEPWVMRCRTQAEMDDLVRVAGFEKVGMETDDAAIFTVSWARKV